MANRYALRMDEPNSWTVFDVFTGQPAEFEQKPTVGIRTRHAEKLVAQLNSQDAQRREQAGRTS
ncbi:hypothetical protein [Mesorhizobium sp. B2-7-1]|uniref:hypothetical protein n=1 Tax=Mesorhizobium sp. B2-7-1 TaxID=2589909 RepID=UPI00112D64BB|nr:hypothetical protein [Mesorhizobium sp. B2-7-1]TPJ43808.1 hypothetical protein FJ471_33170 [Mesorhizobium sp. B2-7-1]